MITLSNGIYRGSQTDFLNLLKHKPQVVFDIETGPKPDNELLKFFDESAVDLPEHPGIFDLHSVKYGHMVDPIKKAAKAQQAQEAHAARVAGYQREVSDAKKKAFDKLRESAPLKSYLNRVLAIGYLFAGSDGEFVHLHHGHDSEKQITEFFWSVATIIRKNQGTLYTFNGEKFDIPQMTAKAWMHSIQCPYLLTKYNKMEDWCVDIRKHFEMGTGYNNPISLKNAAKALNVQGKLEGVSGDMFHTLYKDNQAKALEYLEKDVLATYAVGRRIGAIVPPTSTAILDLVNRQAAYESKKENLNDTTVMAEQ